MQKKLTKKSLFVGLVIVLNLLLLIVFVGPKLSFAKGDIIYVNASASGKEDGSASNPFNTITEALEKAKKGDKIFVAKGKYKENIFIDDKIKIFGTNAKDVIIEADSKKRPVVTMDDNSEINKVTVRKGRIGIEIRKNDEDISIIDCIIEDNERDGIRIEKGSIKKSEGINITKSTIKNNGWNGIYSQRRRVVLIDNEIKDNSKDGVELESGSSAWIYENKIRDNRGVGLKLFLDNSDIWIKKNDIRENKKSGIEVKAFGGNGRIDISKSKIVKNKYFSVARVQTVNMQKTIWNGLTFSNENEMFENLSGNVSNIIRVW